MLGARRDHAALVPHAHRRQIQDPAAALADPHEQVLLLFEQEELRVEAPDRVERRAVDQAGGARHPRHIGRRVPAAVVAVARRQRDPRAEPVQLAVIARVDRPRRRHELWADGRHTVAERRQQALHRARLDDLGVGVEDQQRPRVVPRGQQVVPGAEADVVLGVDELDRGVRGGERGQVVARRVVEHEHAVIERSDVGQHRRKARLQLPPGAVVDHLDRDVERHAAIIGSRCPRPPSPSRS